MSAFVRIGSWEDIPRAIGIMQQAGAGHRVPLMQALYHGSIAHLEVQRSGSSGLFKRWSAAARLPSVLLIGDDDHAVADGPATWPIAPRVLRWARFVLIHGGVGEPEHYHYAVALAEAFGRLVMIECSSTSVEAWQKAASRWAIGAEGQIMQPPLGCPHPSLRRGDLN